MKTKSIQEPVAFSDRYKLGTELSASDQSNVLRSYVHRFTRQHVPQWAKKPMPNSNAYPVQFNSDADWLANTRFAVTKSGKLDSRVSDCMSSATWPDNPELRTVANA